MLQIDIQHLWFEQKVEEEFINAFLSAGFIMLENPANTKIQEIKDLLF